MGAYGQTADLTKNNLSLIQTDENFRPVAGVSFPLGACVKIASRDQQIYPDMKTVNLSSTGTGQQLLVGLVKQSWPGFNAAGSVVAPAATARGTFDIPIVTAGAHPAALIDQSGTGATTITNETPLVPSRATAGRLQGVATAVGALGTAAVATLPASGIASSISAGALVQASATDTLTGTPAAGDVLSVTVQIPYNTANPGVAQTRTITTTLTSGQAASVTTAAAALVAALTADPVFAQFYVASNAAGVITVAVNTLSAKFLVTYGSTLLGLTDQFTVGLSGSIGNSMSFAAATVSGATVSTASGAALTGGVGYLGTLPVWVV